MATETYFTNKQPFPQAEIGRLFCVSAVIDFTKKNVAANDVVPVLNIKGGTTVLEVDTRVMTAEGGTLTVDVGDGDGANSWDNNVDLNATAGTMTKSAPGTDTYATTGKSYSADDTIDLKMDHAADAAKVCVTALCYTTPVS